MNRPLFVRVALALLAIAMFAVPAQASAGKHHGGKKPLVVCKHGCQYRTIQKAVNNSGRNDTIKIKPGTYREGVIVEGSKHDGLTIEGTSKNPRKTVLDGKNVQTPDGFAQNAIEGLNVKKLTLKNMWGKNYLSNGFFVHSDKADDGVPNSKIRCRDYLMKNLIASFNRGYGLFAFGCIGGRITQSTGWGQGDSAFYIGATPPQAHPKWTSLDHLDGHENVLGFSGTNSRYVDIKQSNFYNNGVGIVPNTLTSEPYIQSEDGKIHDNNIFWNNFNYFLPNSRVDTVSDGLGEIGGQTVQYPTGVGIVMLGTDGWVIRDNNIFGNFKYGAVTVSNPLVDNNGAVVKNNSFIDNKMGRNGSDTNAVDFFADGSGNGNCWSGNDSSTFDHSSTSPDVILYQPCPGNPNLGGTGTSIGNGEQFGEIVNYATTDPPENQECSWTKHSHPKFKSYKALNITPGPNCN
jgi:hypothetical protein